MSPPKRYFDPSLLTSDQFETSSGHRAFRVFPKCLFKTCKDAAVVMMPSRRVRRCVTCEENVVLSYFWFALCVRHRYGSKRMVFNRTTALHESNIAQCGRCQTSNQVNHEDIIVA